jgi:RNA polymerase sigma-32 factor
VQHSIDDDESFALLASEDPNPEEAVIAQSSQSLIRARLFEAMALLPPMDREVLQARTLRQPPESIQDLATRMAVTPAKLRQVERRAMTRLKYELAARGVLTSKMH